LYSTCSIVEQNIKGVDFESITEEVGDPVAAIQAMVRGTSIVNACTFFVFTFP